MTSLAYHHLLLCKIKRQLHWEYYVQPKNSKSQILRKHLSIYLASPCPSKFDLILQIKELRVRYVTCPILMCCLLAEFSLNSRLLTPSSMYFHDEKTEDKWESKSKTIFRKDMKRGKIALFTKSRIKELGAFFLKA